jgi:hypothetical protein
MTAGPDASAPGEGLNISARDRSWVAATRSGAVYESPPGDPLIVPY